MNNEKGSSKQQNNENKTYNKNYKPDKMDIIIAQDIQKIKQDFDALRDKRLAQEKK